MFDVKKDRLLYGDMLIPEKDFVLERAVGTTYGLNLEALVSICITLGLSEDTDSIVQNNGAAILQALTAVADKLLIFTDATHISNLRHDNKIISLLDNIVIPVIAGKKRQELAAFHPKVWVAEYLNKKKHEKMYRLIIMSRNISFDRSYDISVEFNGYVQEEEVEETKPLIDFLHYLKDNINYDIENSREKKASMDVLINSLRKVKFFVNDDVNGQVEDSNPFFHEDIQLLPIGIGEEHNTYDIMKDPFMTESFKYAIIMSPFLDSEYNGNSPTIASFNDRITCNSEYNCLFTRVSELEKIKREHVNKMVLFVMDPDVVNGESTLDSEENLDIVTEQDIHAKIYFLENEEHVYLYIGSLNCSRAALHTNVEFLVKLKPKFNHTQMYRDFIPFGEKNPIFVRETVKEPKEDETQNKDKEIERSFKKLCRLNLSGEIVKETEKYKVRLYCDDEGLFLENLNVKIKPLMLAESEYASFNGCAIFDGLEMQDLSFFFNVKIENKVRIFSIPVANMPQGRREAIIQNAHIDSKSLISFLFYFLSGDVPEYIGGPSNNKRKSDKNKDGSYNRLSGIFEVMLKTAASNPEKLEDIRKWLTDYNILSNSSDDEESAKDVDNIIKIQSLLNKICDALAVSNNK